jgi:hypothetical protein
MMKKLVIKSWFLLIYFEAVIRLREFKYLHSTVRNTEVQIRSRETMLPSAELCRAMDVACVFYFKRVLCLQRSAATTCLLRQHGWTAEMVIGAQLVPFKSHAWVEIDGAVVNDKPYVVDIYQVLERC